MKELSVNGNNFHDGIVRNLSFDFQNKKVSLLLEQNDGNDLAPLLRDLVFTGVVWQNIQNLHQFNLIWGIEVSTSYHEFLKREANYLDKMKNYLPNGILESIETNTQLSFYYLNSSTGLEGFIICQNLEVITR